jgi:hypothetical protein
MKGFGLCLLVVMVSGQSGPCPIFGSSSVTKSRHVTIAAAPYTDDDYVLFEMPAAPEQNLNATFAFTSPDALDPADVFAEAGYNCQFSGTYAFQVTLTSDGLTRVKGTFARDASFACIDTASGQRQAAYWYIKVGRVANQEVTITWEADYVPYLGIGQ